jgi:hypothetical protein
MLESVMMDAITFADNLEAASIIDNRYAVAYQKIYEITQLLDKNVQQFDRLISKFASTHPDFVAGYHMNSASDNPVLCQTGMEGAINQEIGGMPLSNALVSVAGKRKEVIADSKGKLTIHSMYGCDSEMTVAASGFASKTLMVRVPCGTTAKVDMAI